MGDVGGNGKERKEWTCHYPQTNTNCMKEDSSRLIWGFQKGLRWWPGACVSREAGDQRRSILRLLPLGVRWIADSRCILDQYLCWHSQGKQKTIHTECITTKGKSGNKTEYGKVSQSRGEQEYSAVPRMKQRHDAQGREKEAVYTGQSRLRSTGFL